MYCWLTGLCTVEYLGYVRTVDLVGCVLLSTYLGYVLFTVGYLGYVCTVKYLGYVLLSTWVMCC